MTSRPLIKGEDPTAYGRDWHQAAAVTDHNSRPRLLPSGTGSHADEVSGEHQSGQKAGVGSAFTSDCSSPEAQTGVTGLS